MRALRRRAPHAGSTRAAPAALGIAYKDAPAEAAGFIARSGVAYARLGADHPGTVAIDWGVTGVPESFLVDHTGIIRGHWVGGLTDAVVAGDLLPRAAAL